MASDSYGPSINYTDPFNLEDSVRRALMEHSSTREGGAWRPSKVEQEGGTDVSLLDMGSANYSMALLQNRKEDFRVTTYMNSIQRAISPESSEDFLDIIGADMTEVMNSDSLSNASKTLSNGSSDSPSPGSGDTVGVVEVEGIKVTPGGKTFPVASKKSRRFNITNNFGVSRSGVGTTVPHGGVDINGTGIDGQPVVACEDGRIYSMYINTSWMGNGILLEVEDTGMFYMYAHMRGFAPGMRQGLKVRVGQVLGQVGTTGKSTGPHLHFERRVAPTGLGTTIGAKDPYPYLQRIIERATIPLDKYLSGGVSPTNDEDTREDPRARWY